MTRKPSVLSESLIQKVGILLCRLSLLVIALPVQHPCRDLELQRLADHCHNLVHLIRCELACALVQVNVALLAHLGSIWLANNSHFYKPS